jgi:hypothetical protein
MESKLE